VSRLPIMKKALLVGDPYLCLVAAAAGIDYFVFDNNCERLVEYIRGKIDDYRLLIVLRPILKECSELSKLLEEHREILPIIIDPPKELEKIDPKKHYEEMITKYIGLKFEVK